MPEGSPKCPSCGADLGFSQRPLGPSAFCCQFCGERLRSKPPVVGIPLALAVSMLLCRLLGARGPFVILFGLFLYWPCLMGISFLGRLLRVPWSIVKEAPDLSIQTGSKRRPRI
jgi:hypothetical protein